MKPKSACNASCCSTEGGSPSVTSARIPHRNKRRGVVACGWPDFGAAAARKSSGVEPTTRLKSLRKLVGSVNPKLWPICTSVSSLCISRRVWLPAPRAGLALALLCSRRPLSKHALACFPHNPTAYSDRDVNKEHSGLLAVAVERDGNRASAHLEKHYRETGQMIVEAIKVSRATEQIPVT